MLGLIFFHKITSRGRKINKIDFRFLFFSPPFTQGLLVGSNLIKRSISSSNAFSGLTGEGKGQELFHAFLFIFKRNSLSKESFKAYPMLLSSYKRCFFYRIKLMHFLFKYIFLLFGKFECQLA